MATQPTRKTFRQPDEIFALLTKEPLSPLYLFHGEEAYFIHRAIALVRARLGENPAVYTFYAGEDPLERLLEAWGSASLFSERQLVVLKNAGQLSAADRESLTTEAELRDDSQPLVVCVQGRANLSQKFFSVCAKRGFAGEFRSPFINQIPGWAQRFARERGVRLNAEAASYLADHIGTDLLALSTEIDKLVAFVFPATEIDQAVVRQCMGDLHQHSAFDLAEALGRRNSKRAVRLVQEVLRDEKRALPALHALVSHFRRLWQVKDLSDANAPSSQIERAVGLRGQRLRAAVEQGRVFSSADLRRILRHASQLDLALKSSPTSPRLLFDAFVLDVCGRGAIEGRPRL